MINNVKANDKFRVNLTSNNNNYALEKKHILYYVK